ncbi:MAG TPA: hypothetical protein VKD65_05340 [Candidatus Angelobacter sp.]|nr:hypothetical protein [Candidatus Angelobacter sp.]
MARRILMWLALAAVGVALILGAHASQAAKSDKEALIKDALSAAPPDVAKTAKVIDWDGKVLKEGSGAYTCYPTPAQVRSKGKEPMCLDKTWLAWADAWVNKKPFKAGQVGIGYMLAGDTGSSNIDPYAEGPTNTNQWVVEGPHTMVIVPDVSQLEGLSADPNNGGAYLMWKGTPYVHIMVPVGKRPAAKK